MKLNPNYYRKVWWCIVIIGSFLVGMASSAVPLFQQHKAAVVVIWCIVLIAIWYSFNAYWMHTFMNYLRSLEPIRTTAPNDYRRRVEQLLQWKHSAQVTAIIHISLVAVDCDQWDFAAAKERMQQVEPQKIHGLVRLCYWLNMIYILFHLEEIEEAKQLWAEYSPKLLEFADNSVWGFTVQTVMFFDAFYSSDLQQAREQYDRMQQNKNQTSHYDQQEMDYLDSLLQNHIAK